MEKNTLLKLLRDKNIEFKIRSYPIDLRDTTLVAKFINVPTGQLFKSLVIIKNDANPILAMIPSESYLNLENLEIELGIKELKLAPRTLAEKLTGMQVGGISPLGLLDMNFPIYIAQSVTQHDWIVFSAGQRGVTIQLSVLDLLTITNAHVLPNDMCTR